MVREASSEAMGVKLGPRTAEKATMRSEVRMDWVRARGTPRKLDRQPPIDRRTLSMDLIDEVTVWGWPLVGLLFLLMEGSFTTVSSRATGS